MSIIKEDGGGTQYTFLEAIYHDCVLILHHDWISKGNIFKKNINCFVVGNNNSLKPEEEIKLILDKGCDVNYNKILKNSKKILQKHLELDWF